jgi:hypothetical protein
MWRRQSGSCDASAIVTTIRISMLYISCQPQAVLLGQPRAGKRRESHGSQTSHAELAEAQSSFRWADSVATWALVDFSPRATKK